MAANAVIREPDQQMPEEFRKLVLEKFKGGFGYASPQENARIDIDTFASDGVDLEDTLKKLEKNYAKDRMFYSFSDGTEDLQPFSVLDNGEEGEKEEVYLSVIAEGNFPKHETPRAFVDNYIVPLVSLLWEKAGGTMDKWKEFMDLFEAEDQKDSIRAELGDRAVVLFIPFKGIATTVYKNTEQGKWPWGYATRGLGFSAPAADAGPKKISIKKPVAAAVEEKTTHPPGGTAVKLEELYAPLLSKKDGPCLFVINKGELWCKPPVGSDMKRGKKWWDDHSTLERPKDAALLFAGFPASALKVNSPIATLRDKVLNQSPQPKKADNEQKDPPKVEADVTLFIPKEKKEKYLAMKKEGKLPGCDTTALLATIRDYPKASVQLGENQGDILMMHPIALARICHTDAHLAACLMHEMRCSLLELYGEEQPQEEVVQPEKKPEEQSTAGPKKLSIRKTA